MLTSWPCFPNVERRTAPLDGYNWTHTAAIVILVLCMFAAAATGAYALQRYRAVSDEREGGHDELAEVGAWAARGSSRSGRSTSGFGFAATNLVNLVGYLMVPRCLG